MLMHVFVLPQGQGTIARCPALVAELETGNVHIQWNVFVIGHVVLILGNPANAPMSLMDCS